MQLYHATFQGAHSHTTHLRPLTELWEPPALVGRVHPGVRPPGQLPLLVRVQDVEVQAVLELLLVQVVHVQGDVVPVLAVLGLQAQLEAELLVALDRNLCETTKLLFSFYLRGGGKWEIDLCEIYDLLTTSRRDFWSSTKNATLTLTY